MLFALLFSCVKQSGFVTHVTSPNESGCSYVAIRKDETRGLIFRDHKYLKETDSIFMCCPDSEGKVYCQKALFTTSEIQSPNTSSIKLY